MSTTMTRQFRERSVLFLNINFEIIDIISWRKAITLFFKEKVKIHEEFEDSQVSSPSYSMNLPSIVVSTEWKESKSKRKSINLNRKNLLIRDNHTCSYCGKTLTEAAGTIDHVIPVSRNGKNVWSNVVAACGKCNKKKDDNTPDEANMKLLRQPFIPTKDIFLRKYLKNKEYECWRPYVKLKEQKV